MWLFINCKRMLDLWALSIVALGLLLCIGAQLQDDLPVDYCHDMPFGGYKRHPYDCSRYVSCFSRSNFHTQACPSGLMYDEQLSFCNYGPLVDCGTSPRPRPAPTAPRLPPTRPPPRGRSTPSRDGGFLREVSVSQRRPAPSKTAVLRNTEPAMVHAVHQEDLSSFVKVVTPPRAPRNNPVPSCDSNGLYPNVADCSGYYICSFGEPFAFSCPAGTYFHPELLRCEFLSGFGGRDPCSGQRSEVSRTTPSRAPRLRDTTRGRTRGSTRGSTRGQAPRPTNAGDMLSNVAGFLEEGKAMAIEKVNNAVKMESKMAGRARSGQSAFRGVANFLGSNKIVKKMSLAAEQQLETLKIIKEKFDLSKDEVKMVMTKMHSTLDRNPSRVVPDTPRDRIKMDLDTCPYPDEERRSRCRKSSPYRTIDGSCNNLKHPLWGRSMTPLTRFVDPDYCDNIGCPRRGRFNQTLPSARKVSRSLFTAKPEMSHVHTTMLLTAGQFLDHDLTKTALSMLSTDASGTHSSGGGTLSEVTCGSDGCSTQGEENRACMPIEIPSEDTAFGSLRCLMFVRTQEVPQLDCQLGPRQQLNQLSHYMDASMIYGSTREEMEGLREENSGRGRMKTTKNPNPSYKPLLPHGNNKECRDFNATIRCFKAGDERVNENVPLTGLHVIFVRVHNHIEGRLHRLNPKWGGERLFQETRKIVGALWQHIVYNEYLPIILGPRAMSRYGLVLQSAGFSHAYDSSVSPDIANVFATAAFRFSHSMIPDMVIFSDRNYRQTESKPLSQLLRRPYEVYNNGLTNGSAVDAIMHGIMSQSAMRIDRHFSKQVTEHLFAENPPNGPGTDLASINIQRGRDHGLPSYNAWRKWCGLPVARDFDDLVDLPLEDRDILRNTYDNVDEVDIFPAAVCENNVAGGMVGPTFACILGRQFRNLRVADRFWYENSEPTVGFNREQLDEIRKITLSKLICKASDVRESENRVQKYAMLRPISEAFRELGRRNYAEVYSLASLYHGEQNERRLCTSLPDIDLTKWKQ